MMQSESSHLAIYMTTICSIIIHVDVDFMIMIIVNLFLLVIVNCPNVFVAWIKMYFTVCINCVCVVKFDQNLLT